jgi:trehalose 6-phosphate phosphatase
MSATLAIASALTSSIPVRFFDRLSQSRQRVLLLDYDGTIAPFSTHRNQAFPYPSVPELLDCIMSTCQTYVALISGRAAREVPPLLGLNPHPEIWGTGGIERLDANDQYSVADVNEETGKALAQAHAAVQHYGLEPLAELKPGALAIHWRNMNSSRVEEIRAKAYRAFSPFTGTHQLLLSEFDGGVELRLRTRSKGDVVRAMLARYDVTVPIAYLGDDSTDEEAFRVLNSRGLTVLVRPSARFTAAQMWLRPPDELIQFLQKWVQACGGQCSRTGNINKATPLPADGFSSAYAPTATDRDTLSRIARFPS